MLSFIHMLRDTNTLDKKDFSGINFYSLPVIDPSKLSDSESLLGVVVARVYESMRNIVLGKRNNISQEDQRNVIRTCEEAYQSIRVKYQSIQDSIKQNYDDLEHLSQLANTSKLRKSLQEMVQAYLKLCIDNDDPNNNYQASDMLKNTFLIVPVDDLDMNVTVGYKLAEEIRSFFLILISLSPWP